MCFYTCVVIYYFNMNKAKTDVKLFLVIKYQYKV